MSKVLSLGLFSILSLFIKQPPSNKFATCTVVGIKQDSRVYQYGIRCGYEIWIGETLSDLGLPNNSPVKLALSGATMFVMHDRVTDRMLNVAVADLPEPR